MTLVLVMAPATSSMVDPNELPYPQVSHRATYTSHSPRLQLFMVDRLEPQLAFLPGVQVRSRRLCRDPESPRTDSGSGAPCCQRRLPSAFVIVDQRHTAPKV